MQLNKFPQQIQMCVNQSSTNVLQCEATPELPRLDLQENFISLIPFGFNNVKFNLLLFFDPCCWN